MAPPPLNNCTAAYNFAKHAPMYGVGMIQATLSILSLTLLIWICIVLFQNKHIISKRTAQLHTNLKILLISGGCFYAIHAIAVLSSDIAFVQIPFFNKNDQECSYLTPTWKCLLVCVPMFLCVIGFTTLHVAMFIERCLATFYFSEYERRGPIIGSLLSISMVFVSCAVDFFLFYKEEFFEYE
ncbi:serpentine type 7TM GPCR receptor class ab chemoreceptor domain-containing protein [Ditylenchus destructor]|uniref:Serpentine type 7TM GPCR receptor class ab chemoreceptor domain-containing protein n=1 Tax=Ditylenchus destructor TaxID=166010 RepID=A0AAD4N1H8_9BILA|nr:serpentine type 7TM GPCR receptor class ab chemoreceptor domain-containing protein [Ditylenchus destructor]